MLWHKLSPADVLKELGTDEHGLSNNEVGIRRAKFGYNKLPEAKPKSIFGIFFRQFQSPIIYILIIAAVAVYFLGEFVDAAIIGVVLFINAVVGSIQEGKAQNALNALKHLVSTNATVIREGKEIIIPDYEIVVGDILILKEGDKIPADARVIEVNSCKVDESSMTGESEPVSKNIESIDGENVTVSDQVNMVFRGTYIVGGESRAVVVETGINTVIGAISVKLVDVDTDVPLKKNIKALSRGVIISVLTASTIVFFIGILRGIGIREMFAAVVAMSVSAIPEGLPIVVTVVLATGIYRMSKRNALVKKLQAVEALGQAKVIAVDKTGTVTFNQMMVEKLYVDGITYDVAGNGYEPRGELLEAGSIIEFLDRPAILLAGKIAALTASSSVAYSEEKKEWQRVSGDPTEAALCVFSKKIGFSKDDLEREHEKVLEIPFNSTIKYHAVAHSIDEKIVLSVSGAPETILSSCNHIWQNGETKEFSQQNKENTEEKLLEMLHLGLRVIALAVRFKAPKEFETTDLPELCFVGFVGISDSIRGEVYQAVKDAESAGVRVVMITGDHSETAKAIAIKVGIYKEGSRVITGKDLHELPELEFLKILPDVSIFARIAPEDKLKIIEAYRKNGEIIAMTGDGVNDALSLAAADLGVAMGKIGTEVAKEAADIVLLDDNFGSIVSAIEEGRNIYRTIKKVILYLFSTSLGEIFTIAGAIIIGLPLPVIASQIIWLNFITDGFLVIPLALEPKGTHLLDKQLLYNRSKWLVDKLMVKRMILVGLTMMIGTLILFSYYLPQGYLKASTVALTLLAMYQWFNAWNCRSEKQSIFHKGIFRNKYLLGATILIILLQIMAIYTPFMQKILHTTPLALYDWFIIFCVALPIVIVEEIRKIIARLRA